MLFIGIPIFSEFDVRRPSALITSYSFIGILMLDMGPEGKQFLAQCFLKQKQPVGNTEM